MATESQNGHWPKFNWQDKHVVLTGGAGFLGRRVHQLIREAGLPERQITIPRRDQYDLRHRDAVQQLFTDVQHQLRATHLDLDQVVILHLAGDVGGIGYNQNNPGSLFYDNLMMGVQLMETARQQGVLKFVAVGTVCAYPKFTPVPFREEALWDGYPEETNAPYGLAKKMLLVQAQTYRQQYDFNAIYLLPANLYGPGDNIDPASSHVIPALIKKCIDAQPTPGRPAITVWGDGSPTREFLFVDDAARGIILATERFNGPQPVNLGSGEEISIRQLAETIAELTGFAGDIVYDTSKPNGQPRRKLDVSRARRLFGFQAQTDFRTGLAQTIAWFREMYPAGKIA